MQHVYLPDSWKGLEMFEQVAYHLSEEMRKPAMLRPSLVGRMLLLGDEPAPSSLGRCRG